VGDDGVKFTSPVALSLRIIIAVLFDICNQVIQFPEKPGMPDVILRHAHQDKFADIPIDLFYFLVVNVPAVLFRHHHFRGIVKFQLRDTGAEKKGDGGQENNHHARSAKYKFYIFVHSLYHSPA